MSPAKPDSRLHLSLGWDSEPLYPSSLGPKDQPPLPSPVPHPLCPKEPGCGADVVPPVAHFLAASANSSFSPSDVKFFFFFFLLIPLGETDVGGEDGGAHPHSPKPGSNPGSRLSVPRMVIATPF